MITNSPKTLEYCDQRIQLWAKKLVLTILLNHRNTSQTIVVTRNDYQVVKYKEFEMPNHPFNPVF
jgi:hypothetical protein